MLLNNRYQIIQTLGSGGFGETFLAEDIQMPSLRRCVIKQLKPIVNNPQIYQLVQERFQREAAILEDLGGSTDQIPTLYAYFQSEGKFYLVQEWIEGETLTFKVRQQRVLSESAVREILVSLLPVLEYVHSKRIVHRDIKPDNIILRYRDGKPVLIDFGAVRESMGTVVNSQGNPTSSIVIGTPGFMPSEQAAGRPMYSSDLYSLGITAIYLLTGKQPQEIETDHSTGEIVWRSYALNVSPTLASVIDKAIAYHPRDRFASAREMLQSLQGIPVAPTVAATPPPPTLPPPQPQNTIPVAPAASYQSANQSQSSVHGRGIFLGSLIAGGLIGASVIIGLALNKTPQQVAKQPASEPTASPVEPEDTASPPPKTPISQPEEPVPEQTETPSTPITSQTPISADKPSPEQFVQNYFSIINNGEYQTGWNQLSPNYQSNQRLHPNGYLSYIDWWGGQVQQVEVQQVSLVEENSETATVDVQLKYLMKTGKEVSSSVRFGLLWDAQSSRWVVADTK